MNPLDTVKDISNLVKKFNDIELNRQILNLEEEVLGLTRTNRDLNEQVETLKKAIGFSKSLKYDEQRQIYFAEGDNVPFCPKCWEAGKKQSHLTLQKWNKGIRYDCRICNFYHVPEDAKNRSVGRNPALDSLG